jgi:hypothetical protein
VIGIEVRKLRHALPLADDEFPTMLQTLRIAGLTLRQHDPKYNKHFASRYDDTSSKMAHGSPACFRWLSSGENGCSIR